MQLITRPAPAPTTALAAPTISPTRPRRGHAWLAVRLAAVTAAIFTLSLLPRFGQGAVLGGALAVPAHGRLADELHDRQHPGGAGLLLARRRPGLPAALRRLRGLHRARQDAGRVRVPVRPVRGRAGAAGRLRAPPAP